MTVVRLVIPEAPAQQAVSAPAPRSIKGKGLRLGTLDNSKSNADHLLRMLIEGVKAEIPIESVVSYRKPSVSEPAAHDILDRLTEEADVVISAMAD
jgi:hypothetical protein